MRKEPAYQPTPGRAKTALGRPGPSPQLDADGDGEPLPDGPEDGSVAGGGV